MSASRLASASPIVSGSHLTTWRSTLCEEVLALPPRAHTGYDVGLRTNLTLSIRAIDFGLGVVIDSGYDLTTLRLGQLMVASGFDVKDADPSRNFMGTLPWFGSLKDVEQRLATCAKRRGEAHLALADALLSDEERATRDAESAALRDTLNTLYLRMSSDGRTLVAYRNKDAWRNNDPLDPEEMTPLESQAVEWAQVAHQGGV